jgi:hypothetical protein
MALALQQRFFSFALNVRPHFQYIHAHRVPFEFSTTIATISLLQRSPRSTITLLQTMIVTRSNVTLFNSSNQQRSQPALRSLLQ